MEGKGKKYFNVRIVLINQVDLGDMEWNFKDTLLRI